MDEKIILAAIDEMQIHSMRFTMDDLTRRLRMSKTSLYKIVDSKDNLVHEIISYLMESFETAESAIQIENISAREKITQFVDEYTKIFNLLESGIYNDLKILYADEWNRCEEFRRKKINTLIKFIDEGIENGEFRAINSAVLQRCLLMMSSLLTDTKFLNENDLTYSQAIDSLRDLVFYGILKRD